MVQFLEETQGVATPALSAEEVVELEMLRIKHEKLKALVNKAGTGAQGAAGLQEAVATKKKKAKGSSSGSGSSSDSEVS